MAFCAIDWLYQRATVLSDCLGKAWDRGKHSRDAIHYLRWNRLGVVNLKGAVTSGCRAIQPLPVYQGTSLSPPGRLGNLLKLRLRAAPGRRNDH